MNKLSRKLRDLERNVVSETPDFEETRMVINNEAEQKLHDRVKTILENYRYRLDEAQEALKSDSGG